MTKTCRCTAPMKPQSDGTWRCLYGCPTVAELKPKPRRLEKSDDEKRTPGGVHLMVGAAMKRLGLGGSKYGAALPAGMVRNRKAGR